MLEFDSKYPNNPQTLGEKLRKASMDKGLLQRELASQLGVTEDTVINWEIRGRKPVGRNQQSAGILKKSLLDFTTFRVYYIRRRQDAYMALEYKAQEAD